MDRLLCGDVGFGKTEVALRAAMKCMLDGKQVRDPGPDDRSGPAALPDGHAPLCGFPVTHRRAFPLPHAGADQEETLFDLQSRARSI